MIIQQPIDVSRSCHPPDHHKWITQGPPRAGARCLCGRATWEPKPAADPPVIVVPRVGELLRPPQG